MPKKLGKDGFSTAFAVESTHRFSGGGLFLLKSLDLDLRFRWKPGTVFSYERKDYFK